MKIITMGFTCLDIINSNGKKIINLGGTAGNVASVLASLGTEVYNFVPTYSDKWNLYMHELLLQRGIRCIEYTKTNKCTPRVIEEFNVLENKHHFLVTCPQCGRKLSELTLPTLNQITDKVGIVESADLIFSDRMSGGISKSIEIVRNNRGLSIYEPNVCRFYNQLLNGAGRVDIVKFSNERVLDIYSDKLRIDLKSYHTKLIINTLGKSGLKYCIKKEDGNFSPWIYLDPIKTDEFVDASGAGDWLSAMFIFYFLSGNRNEKAFTEQIITETLMKAQQISSFVCGFIGAQELFNNSKLQAAFENRFGIELVRNVVNIEKPDTKGQCELCYNVI